MGGIDVIFGGFGTGVKLTNGLIFGGGDKGVEAGGSPNILITDVFAFNNVGDDYDSGSTITLVNTASEDLTGDFTGYTSSELVDFAGGDYRTKAASDLATLGSGGSFIGAFLEVSSGVTVTGVYYQTLMAGN